MLLAISGCSLFMGLLIFALFTALLLPYLLGLVVCASQGTFSGVCFCPHHCQIKLFIFTSFLMGWHLGSGDHESTVKTHKNGEWNFHLKGGSRQGPTKQSGAIPAERGHRGRRLAQRVTKD